MIEPSPEYECAAYGQDQYRTFDGRWIVFHHERCEFIMMEGDGVKISVKNEPCRLNFCVLYVDLEFGEALSVSIFLSVAPF